MPNICSKSRYVTKLKWDGTEYPTMVSPTQLSNNILTKCSTLIFLSSKCYLIYTIPYIVFFRMVSSKHLSNDDTLQKKFYPIRLAYLSTSVDMKYCEWLRLIRTFKSMFKFRCYNTFVEFINCVILMRVCYPKR